MKKTLPAQPNLDWLKKTAKERLAELRAREPSAKLRQAQLAVVGDYGFPGWRTLKAQVDARQGARARQAARRPSAQGRPHRRAVESAAAASGRRTRPFRLREPAVAAGLRRGQVRPHRQGDRAALGGGWRSSRCRQALARGRRRHRWRGRRPRPRRDRLGDLLQGRPRRSISRSPRAIQPSPSC